MKKKTNRLSSSRYGGDHPENRAEKIPYLQTLFPTHGPRNLKLAPGARKPPHWRTVTESKKIHLQESCQISGRGGSSTHGFLTCKFLLKSKCVFYDTQQNTIDQWHIWDAIKIIALTISTLSFDLKCLLNKSAYIAHIRKNLKLIDDVILKRLLL